MYCEGPRRRRATRHIVSGLLAVGLLSWLAAPAAATFHLMQIEQVIGGVCGQVGQQAIQLRMRSSFQNLVAGTRLVARDAAGNNPVILITFPGNVSNSAGGARILSTTSAFTAAGSGPTPDFTLTNPIPASYLLAGKLTFEDSFGGIYWGLAWGGAGYTGTNTGTLDNDADGNFNPPFGEPLDWTTGRALRFPGSSTAASTNNAADYVLTAAEATFTSNDGSTGSVAECLFGDGFETNGLHAWDFVSPP